MMTLRRLRASDASAVFAAFTAVDDLSRQGDVTTPEEAARYVARLLDGASPQEAWAIAESDALIGLVCVTVAEEHRIGWFSGTV